MAELAGSSGTQAARVDGRYEIHQCSEITLQSTSIFALIILGFRALVVFAKKGSTD